MTGSIFCVFDGSRAWGRWPSRLGILDDPRSSRVDFAKDILYILLMELFPVVSIENQTLSSFVGIDRTQWCFSHVGGLTVERRLAR